MNRLFVHVYLDEDVNVLLAALLRSQGWTALPCGEAGQSSASDDEQLQFATDRKMAIVKHNRGDFQQIAADWLRDDRRYSGIVIAVRRPTTHDVARRLLVIWDSITADEMDNQVYYI